MSSFEHIIIGDSAVILVQVALAQDLYPKFGYDFFSHQCFSMFKFSQRMNIQVDSFLSLLNKQEEADYCLGGILP